MLTCYSMTNRPLLLRWIMRAITQKSLASLAGPPCMVPEAFLAFSSFFREKSFLAARNGPSATHVFLRIQCVLRENLGFPWEKWSRRYSCRLGTYHLRECRYTGSPLGKRGVVPPEHSTIFRETWLVSIKLLRQWKWDTKPELLAMNCYGSYLFVVANLFHQLSWFFFVVESPLIDTFRSAGITAK